MSHNIIVFSEGSFIGDVCLSRDDYTVFNNCNYKRRTSPFN